MAQAYKALVVVLSLVLTLSMVNSNQLGIGFGKPDATTPDCNAVHGTESGETCTSVAKEFGLTFEDFLTINPNINCDDIFVGQWLCVGGSA